MTPLAKIAALGVVAVGAATAASVAWVNVGRSPQSAPGTPSTRGDNQMILCVASDSIIHLESGTVCPVSQTPLPLASSPPAPSDPTKPSRHVGDQLADLERRLAALQKSPLFTVVDKQDHPMFAVMSGRAVVYYPSSVTEVVSIGATEDGGILTVNAANDALRVNIAASASRTGLWSERDGVKRLELGQSATGTESLKILTSDGKVVAGIGESRAGTGAIVVANSQGQTLASMTVVDDDELRAGTTKGAVGVFNRKGAAVLSLTEGATGGGLLTIGDATSTPMVKMGVKDNRYGVVLTGPRAGFPLVPRSGLPGSYFLGCAGGSACVP